MCVKNKDEQHESLENGGKWSEDFVSQKLHIIWIFNGIFFLFAFRDIEEKDFVAFHRYVFSGRILYFLCSI